MQIRQSKPLVKKSKKPRQLWLSSILTLFIFATTISGYFLIQNSQDIRRSASEPYDTCIKEGGNWSSTTPCCSGLVKVTSPYGYFCGKAGTCTPGATKCEKEGTLHFEYLCDSSGYYQKNKRCDFGCSGNSCQAGGCTPSSKRCTSDGSAIETCSSDGTGWTKRSCSTNTTCNSQSLTCVSNTPTPTPAATCIKEGGNWSSTTPCCSGLVKVTSPYGYFCGKAGTCTPGATKCEKEGTLHFEYLCDSSGYYQKNKRCDFGCSGNSCQAGGCTPSSKRCTSDGSAIETCSSDGTGWTKRSCSTNTTCNSQSLTCVSNTPTPTAAATCEGTCYTNSSCSAIGKIVASGSCLKSTSICCKEGVAIAASNLKANGEECSNDNECASGHCYGQTSVWQGGGMGAAFASAVNQAQHGKTCQAIGAQELNQSLQETQIKGTLIGLQVYLSFIPGVGPVIQIISASVQGAQAVYTCGQLAQVNANPNIDAGTKTNFKRACVTSSISAATGLIGGGASAVSTFAGSSLSAGTQLALQGLAMTDNVGNIVVSGINANNACQTFGSNSWQCYTAIGNAGVAVGSGALSAYQFGQSYNVYREQQRLTAYYDSVLNSLSPEYLDRLEGLPKQGLWEHKDNLSATLSPTDYPDDVVRVYRGIKDPNIDPRTNLQMADLFRADEQGIWLDNDLNPDQIKISLELIQNQDIDLDAIGYRHKGHPSGSPFLGFSTDHDIALNFATSQQGGQIITADIPRSELYNLEAMHQNIAGELFGNSGHERELGIFGFLDPQYIVEITNVPPVVY